MIRTKHRFSAVLLSLLMTLAVTAVPALMPGGTGAYKASAATTFSDINGHWAKTYIQKAVSLGIVNGYQDGTFRPDNNVTRAEFTRMLNTAVGNTGFTSASFTDVSTEQWFYTDVCKGVAAAFINGYEDGSFGPDNTITRQEAAVILARIVPANGMAKSVESFSDAAEVADWARFSMEKIFGKGYMTGADNMLTPTAYLTRGQAAKIIVEITQKENIITKNQTIVKDEITIDNTIYANQISVGSQVGDGIATLDNCTVLGNVNILGGGNESGKGVFLKNTRAAKVTAARSGASVLISTLGEATVVNTYIVESAGLQEDSTAILSGDFGRGFVNVYMNRKSDLDLNARLEKLYFEESKCDAKIRSGSVVDLMEIGKEASRCNITLEEGSSTGILNVLGTDTVLEGKGSIDAMNVYADNLSYQASPKSLYVDPTVSVQPVQNIDPSAALVITADPADGEKDVAVGDPIELKFSSAVHATGSQLNVLTDTQAASLIQLKKGDSTGPNVEFTAKVSDGGRTVTIIPAEKLEGETAYFIRIGKEDLTDAYKNMNELFLSGFTTEAGSKELNPVEPLPQPEQNPEDASQNQSGESGDSGNAGADDNQNAQDTTGTADDSGNSQGTTEDSQGTASDTQDAANDTQGTSDNTQGA